MMKLYGGLKHDYHNLIKTMMINDTISEMIMVIDFFFFHIIIDGGLFKTLYLELMIMMINHRNLITSVHHGINNAPWA